MNPILRTLWIGAALFATSLTHAHDASWSQSRQPFRIYGNSWYVGTQGLSAILVTSPQGHVLIDGTLEENAAQIEANIRALGFRLRDIKLILNSHAHSDHAGAIAQLARDSGATVAASVAGAKELRSGGDDPDDPQYGMATRYPAVSKVKVVADGGTERVGPITIVAHYTPGHTPGSTSWTWRSCEKANCLTLAYVDSLTALGRDGFRYSDDAARVASFRQSFATVAALPCDILITPHPDASGFMQKIAARDRSRSPAPLIDAGACRAYAAAARPRFEERLVTERQDAHATGK
ncbi:subclass B3 metallo-beta-lactamase [Rhodanobacter glycinis]|uniref:Subclass B3 metallo-beta-lactamase n=1 Tax=Rhodanobacter glycinis TaxID=582702 RepID=A0A502BXW8_9GAMM|nr:subclass B3 metallo-beta-lactamase [Rhodanobacter glycinis]TPG04719.1 subclass B3 metallo-beta-lactamase [Rhodanobacter glycinis]TPG51423.1 subclass B3 metallo-beta-lactamase [Rhodanobacter glycinis]